MFSKTASRLVLLLAAMMLLGWSLVKVPNAEANSCLDCRRQCNREFRACVALGLLGCEEVAAECIANCPC